MAEAPEGTVTLLFTDIEGSTRLLRDTGDGYADLLLTHRRLLREAFEAHGGYEVDTEGDAFFVAFATAGQAVAAAAQAQQALAAHEWPEEQRVWVRMGVHTGEPRLLDGNYIGLDVHHAARVMAAGHGGQVLVSQSTRELLGEQGNLRDLGEHRLKDLSQPQRLYQLQINGLPEVFPALKTLENRPTNLPVQATPLIGRERELGEVAALLLREDVRLVTLTGPGGTGKTRLALQAAANVVDGFADGVYFVSLAAIKDEALLVQTVAQTLGIRERPGQPTEETLHDFLREKQLLLVLDNLEQLLGAASEIATTLAAAPGVRVLATSRAPLRVTAEHLYPVPTLTVANGDVEIVMASEAVQLFASRARAVQPGFELDAGNAPVVAEICVRLDGLPLGIELAAARTRLLSPEAMLARLDQRLPLLTGGNQDHDVRQQTLRATIEWSYNLLTPAEQTLFARLSVFAGGCRIDAAEEICDPDGSLGISVLDGISALIDHSLLKRRDDPDGEPRFWMLETIREYAARRLGDSSGADSTRARHARYFFARISSAFDADLSFAEIVARLDPDQLNIRTALGWAAEHGDFAQLAASVAHLWRLWRRSTGQLEEGLRWIEVALAHKDVLDPDALVLLLHAAGEAWRFAGDGDRALALKLECLAAAERSGSQVRLAETLVSVHVLAELAYMARENGEVEQSRAYLERGLALGGGPITLIGLAEVAIAEADLEGAYRHAKDALAGFKEEGNDHNYASTLSILGGIERQRGRYEAALTHLREALNIFAALGDEQAVGYCLDEFADAAVDAGDLNRAALLYGAACRFSPLVRDDSSVSPATVEALPQSSIEAGSEMTLAAAIRYALKTDGDQAQEKESGD